MRWHKKMCDHLDDPFIQELLYEFKGDGYLVYFGTISLICKENKYDNLTGKASFHGRFLKEKFHISVTKLQQIYDFCQTKGKLLFNFSEKNFEFDFPKILEIKDNQSKNWPARGKNLAPKKKKEEVEVEVEVDKSLSQEKSDPPVKEISGTVKAEKAWVSEYKSQIGETPHMSPAKDRAILKIMVKTHGLESVLRKVPLHISGRKLLTIGGFRTIYNDLGLSPPGKKFETFEEKNNREREELREKYANNF